MKKNVITVLLLSAIMTTYSCKKEKEDQTDLETATEKNTEGSAPAAEPKTFVVTATPESVLLGKNKEASVKIKDLTAIELSNPEATSAGIELGYKIELTNKNAIGGNTIGLGTADFRLELDNGNKIAPSSAYVNAAPEETKLSEVDKFIIPAGAKPTGLVLFYDQTRATVKLEIK
jgi:myo-inositol-hexaphosphate 3-phosphohydrolase